MNADLADVCDRVLNATLNGMGQGMLLGLLVFGFLKLFRGTNAATRHAIELATLILLAALPVVHFAYQGTVDDPILPVPASEWSIDAESESPQNNLSIRNWSLTLPSPISFALISAWFFLSSIRLGFLAVQMSALRRWKLNGANAPENVRELFSKLCVELGVSRAPQLRIAEEITTPMAVGFKEPAVLLPMEVCEKTTGTGLEQILRHELAHIIRRDDWANLLQQTVRALFFFHPAVAWISRRMTIDREIACDDHVLSALGDCQSYALSLTEFASRKTGREMIAAPTAWSSHTQLKERIDMILDKKRNSSPRLGRGKTGLFATCAMIVAVLAFQGAPRLTLAQAANDAPPPEPSVNVNVDARPAPLFAPAPAPQEVAVAAVEPFSHSGPVRVKTRARNDDEVDRRIERLEKMVESLLQSEKNHFRIELKDMDLNSDREEFARMHEKIAKDAEKAAQKARKDAQKNWAFEYRAEHHAEGGPERLKMHRKALEEQRRALEGQMKAVERQIQKLQREQEQLEREQEHNEKRRERTEEKRREIQPQEETDTDKQ